MASSNNNSIPSTLPPIPSDRKAGWALSKEADFALEQSLNRFSILAPQIQQTIVTINNMVPQLTKTANEFEKTAAEVEKMSKTVTEIVADPAAFGTKLVSGVIGGFFGSNQNAPAPNAPNGSQAIATNVDGVNDTSNFKDLMAKFLDSLTTSLKSGVTSATAAISQALLEQIIAIADAQDLEEDDNDILKECSEILKNPEKFVSSQKEAYKVENESQEAPPNHALNTQKPLQYAVNYVWERLNKYHVIVAGVNINNFKNFNSIELNKSENKGVSPISLISAFKTKMAQYCSKWNLKEIPSEEEATQPVEEADKKELNEPEDQELPITQEITAAQTPFIETDITNATDEVMTRFATKTIQFSTMLCVDYIFGPTPENNKEQEKAKGIYRKIMSENATSSQVRKAFAAERYKGIGYYLIQIPYLIVYNLIAPIINDTCTALIGDIKKVLSNEIDVLEVTEKKLKEVYNYFGSIETARHQYLDRTQHNAGTLDGYLEQQVRKYGNKFTEEELFKHLENYLVKNYVKRPNLSIRGFKFPLLTSIAEGIVWGIQKKMLLSYLRRSQTLQTLLVQGTNSVKYAQLGMKTFLKEKLSQVVALIESQANKGPHSYTQVESNSTDTIQKTSLITDDLQRTVRTFSNKTLRFIDIEACENKDEELKALDNQVNDIANQIFKTFNIHLFSTQKPLEDATSNMILMSLKTLMDNKENRGMAQVKTIIDTLMKNYDAPASTESEEVLQKKYLEDISAIDTELKQLITRLSELAVENALAENVRNFSENKHDSVKKFVEETKKSITSLDDTLKNVADEISSLHTEDKKTLNDDPNGNNQGRFEQTKDHLSKMTSSIGRFINKATSDISRAQSECYRDVAGDYCNLLHRVVGESGFAQLQGQLDSIAEENMRLKLIENIESRLPTIQTAITSITNEMDSAQTQRNKRQIEDNISHVLDVHLFPPSVITRIQKEMIHHFDSIIMEKENNENRVQRTQLLTSIETKIPTLEEHYKLYIKTQQSLSHFSEIKALVKKLKDLPRKNTKSHSNVGIEKSAMIEEINKKINELKGLIGGNHPNFSLSNLYALFNGTSPFTEGQLIAFAKDTERMIACEKTLIKEKHDCLTAWREINETRKLLNTNIKSSKTADEEMQELTSASTFTAKLKTDLTQIKILLSDNPLSGKREEVNFALMINQLKEEIKLAQEASNQKVNEVKALLTKNTQEIIAKKEDKKASARELITTRCSELQETMKGITDLLKHFEVKGFIRIGQMHIQHFFEPPIKKKMGEVIGGKIQTLVQALGKPYHYKQLALELILLPVAQAETEGQASQ